MFGLRSVPKPIIQIIVLGDIFANSHILEDSIRNHVIENLGTMKDDIFLPYFLIRFTPTHNKQLFFSIENQIRWVDCPVRNI